MRQPIVTLHTHVMGLGSITRLSLMISAIVVVISLGWAAPVHAQSEAEVAAMRAELAAMREQMAAMMSKVDALEAVVAANDTETNANTAASTSDANEAVQSATNIPTTQFKGAPEVKGPGGFSFKPFGRLQVDTAHVGSPDGLVDAGLGRGTEVRRARIGVSGDISGGFGYKIEVDFADNSAEITDAILTYNANDNLGIVVGQHNNFQGLEELTSSRFTSFMERAAFTDAFGFERRVGVSAGYTAGDLLVHGGVFTDDIDALDDVNESIGGDARIVYAPKVGDAQLHFGGSLHYRDFNDAATTARYRQRPFVHTTDTRLIDTGSFSAGSETGYGAEAAVISGPFHAVAEGYWQKPNRPRALADPAFFGGYVEAGLFLTGGDSRGYKGFKFDRIKPENPFGEGDFGAVQVNARYDYLDLNDAGIIGGTQNAYALSLIWTPTAYTRFLANYARVSYDDATATATVTGDTDYAIDVFGMRAQFDF